MSETDPVASPCGWLSFVLPGASPASERHRLFLQVDMAMAMVTTAAVNDGKYWNHQGRDAG